MGGLSSLSIPSSSPAAVARDRAFLASVQSQKGCSPSSVVASIPEARYPAADDVVVPFCGGAPSCSAGLPPSSGGPSSGMRVRKQDFGSVSSLGGLVKSPSVVSKTILPIDLFGPCSGAPEAFRDVGSSLPDANGTVQPRGSWASIVEKRAFGDAVWHCPAGCATEAFWTLYAADLVILGMLPVYCVCCCSVRTDWMASLAVRSSADGFYDCLQAVYALKLVALPLRLPADPMALLHPAAPLFPDCVGFASCCLALLNCYSLADDGVLISRGMSKLGLLMLYWLMYGSCCMLAVCWTAWCWLYAAGAIAAEAARLIVMQYGLLNAVVYC
ncbi:hypothetical protein Nepgr_022968 [Nepenthes gracilis]|uniref:Transmembrane protein n=1 Tax=Nepenthes gracilis TaxID=150966 RepID=A0AAD3T3H6_NEPGR|nr:hypothetical protein Nepgr_022968 [Nepenthes gracilis]